jgi:hypothetical protein
MSVSVNLYDEHLVADLISKVKGKSSLAALGQQIPVAFVGNKEFTFTMDKDVDLVAENGAKGHGGITMAPITIVPVKFEYGARVSDEFMIASDEEKVAVLEAFNDGFAKKLASGFDMAAIHGVNPRTKVVSDLVKTNSFDVKVDQTVTYLGSGSTADANIETAIALVEAADGDVTGLAISPTVRAALAAITANGVKVYPEFAFGAQPANLGGQPLSVNKTVSTAVKATADAAAATVDQAIIGDFANMFKWGYGKDISFEVIEYGNPDNSDSGDLKGHNQVYLRGEAYLGWAIFDPASFARIIPGVSG